MRSSVSKSTKVVLDMSGRQETLLHTSKVVLEYLFPMVVSKKVLLLLKSAVK
jgi:hypothetical protein